MFIKYLLLCLSSSNKVYEKLRINTMDIRVPKLLQISEVCLNSSSAKEFMEF